jgi:hypothetical protein
MNDAQPSAPPAPGWLSDPWFGEKVEIAEGGVTGESLWLGRIDGSPALRIGPYLVVEADTISARVGLRHLRQGMRASSEAWIKALCYARTGRV